MRERENIFDTRLISSNCSFSLSPGESKDWSGDFEVFDAKIEISEFLNSLKRTNTVSLSIAAMRGSPKAIPPRFKFVTFFVALSLHFAAVTANLRADHESIQIQSHRAFVGRDGKNFVLDGHPLYVNGWNSYWLMSQAVEESTRSRVTNIFKHGAALGMTVCRSWAFNDAAYDALQETVGVYSEQAFKVLKMKFHVSITYPQIVEESSAFRFN